MPKIICAEWTESADVDQDTIEYIVYAGSQYPLEICDTTVCPIPYQDIAVKPFEMFMGITQRFDFLFGHTMEQLKK